MANWMMVKAAMGVVLALWLAGSVYGATIIVDQTGGGNATTIAGGMALAANGDTILVRSGTYVEGWYTVNKAVTLKEDAGAEAIIDGQGTAYAGFNITVDGVRIEGFEIKGCGNGIKSNASFKNVFLKDLNIHNCTSVCISMLGGTAEDCTLANSPYGASYADDATFKGVTFQGLTANALYSCTFTTVEGCTFQSCGSCVRYSSNITVIDSDLLGSTSYGVGNVDNISVTGCKMSGGSCGFVSTTGASVERTLVAHYTCAGFYHSEGSLSSTTFTANNSGICQSEVSIVNSIVYGNTNNLLLFPAPSTIAYSCVPPGLNLNSIANLTPGAGNINADPLFVDAGNDDFRLQAASPCVDAGDPAAPITFGIGAGMRIDMGAFERDHNPGAQHVWIVDKTGAGDSTTIKGAVNLAADSDLILVRSGTYVEEWYTVNKFLAIREDEGAEAVIDGQGAAYAGFNLTADGSEIVGFEIKGCGNGVKSSAAFTKVALKDLYIHNCTSVCISDLAGTAEDCVLSDSPYGASYIQGATLSNVSFQNLASNGVYSGSSSTLIGCTFEGCGSCIRYSSDMAFEGCTFTSPTYYGMANVDGVEATGCVFSGGGANGYAIRECTDVAASRCLFYGWIAAVSYSDVALENVTITGNGKGTDFIEGSIHNSILVGNTDWDLNPTYTSTALRISYSLLDPTVFDLSLAGGLSRELLENGGFDIDAGFNIYCSDPKFVNAAGHDYRLLVDAVNPANSSPAIDSGDPATPVPAGSGGGSRVDMGYAEANVSGVNPALLPKPQGVLKIITAAESVFSPAFVEGTCNAEAQSVTISIDGGDPIDAIRRSPTTWYTNVPLSATAGVHIAVASTDALGNPVSQGQDLAWTETDIMNGVSEIVIRKGDSLLLTGTSTDPNAVTLEIDADGDETVDFTGEPGDTYPHEYAAAGVFTAEAKIKNASSVVLATGTLDITVVEVDLHGPVACQVGFTRDAPAYVVPEASASEDVAYVPSDPVTTAASFKQLEAGIGALLSLTARREAGAAFEARLGSATGPIIARQEVDEFILSNTAADALIILQVGSDSTERSGPATLTMRPLIPNLGITMTVNRPGVTFEGGQTTKELSSNDFVEAGEGSYTYDYRLYLAPEADSMCMSIAVTQEASPIQVVGIRSADNGPVCWAQLRSNKLVVCEDESFTLEYRTDGTGEDHWRAGWYSIMVEPLYDPLSGPPHHHFMCLHDGGTWYQRPGYAAPPLGATLPPGMISVKLGNSVSGETAEFIVWVLKKAPVPPPPPPVPPTGPISVIGPGYVLEGKSARFEAWRDDGTGQAVQVQQADWLVSEINGDGAGGGDVTPNGANAVTVFEVEAVHVSGELGDIFITASKDGVSGGKELTVVKIDNWAAFKMVEDETPLTLVEGHYRTLGGMRLHLRTDIHPAGLGFTLHWTATDGRFYSSYKHDAPLSPRNDPDVFWQGPFRVGIDATITPTYTFPDAVALGTDMEAQSRVLQQGLDGDDTRMLQSFLRLTGFSQSATPGAEGTPVAVDGAFGPGTHVAVTSLQGGDQITQDGVVGNAMLDRIRAHWEDYLAAYDAYPDSPVVGLDHPAANGWLDAASEELKKTLTDARLQSISPTATRRELLRQWVVQETQRGHWGYKANFRTVLGSDHGSIGFSQILNAYVYGRGRGGLPRLLALDQFNLYHPRDAIVAMAYFSNNVMSGVGGGFHYAFDTPQTYKHKTDFKLGSYPRLGDSYEDDNKDLLSKALMAYNRGAGLSAFRDLTWPEMLKNYAPPQAGTPFGTRTSIKYSLDIQKRTQGISLRSWTWTDKKDEQAFSFTYGEQDWLDGKTWESVRDAAAP